jgi:hypothetical protein
MAYVLFSRIFLKHKMHLEISRSTLSSALFEMPLTTLILGVSTTFNFSLGYFTVLGSI